jgi:hypothetical protein
MRESTYTEIYGSDPTIQYDTPNQGLRTVTRWAVGHQETLPMNETGRSEQTCGYYYGEIDAGRVRKIDVDS